MRAGKEQEAKGQLSDLGSGVGEGAGRCLSGAAYAFDAWWLRLSTAELPRNARRIGLSSSRGRGVDGVGW